MKVKQLELDLWDVLSTARQTPEDANFLMVFKLLDLIPKHKEEATDDIREKGERG